MNRWAYSRQIYHDLRDSNGHKVHVKPKVVLIGEDDAVRTGAECSRKEQILILDVVGETGEILDEIVELDRVIAVVGSPRAINIYRTTWKM